jgi:hypothetical protein
MMHEFYKLTSAGAAYDLEIGFEPDMVVVYNKTKWATDATVVKSFHFKGDAAASALNEITDDGGVNRAIIAANGFTVVASSTAGRVKSAVSAFTKASPGVGTVASTVGFVTGDTVKLHGVAGMKELNGETYEIVVINATTFSLVDPATGVAIDTTDFAAYVAGTNDFLVNLSDVTEDTGCYCVTLGTGVIGVDSDELIVEAIQGSTFTNKGDIA